jgi:hypothetical protein
MPAATRTILALLVEEPLPWSVQELAREIGKLPATLDALDELHRAGLANRINKRFVCASRAALCASRLEARDA